MFNSFATGTQLVLLFLSIIFISEQISFQESMQRLRMHFMPKVYDSYQGMNSCPDMAYLVEWFYVVGSEKGFSE